MVIMVKDFQFEGHDRGGKIVRAYDSSEVDSLIADLGQNPEKTLTVSPSGADYTSIQDALDACTGPGWTIMVYPGTYSESLTFTQNKTSIIGVVSAGGQQVVNITNENADIVDYGNTSGCIIKNCNINLTNASSEVFAIKKGTSGVGKTRFCRITTTCTTGGINAGVGYSAGGELYIEYGRCFYTNNVSGGLGSRKAAFRVSPAGGTIILKNLCRIDVNTDGICGVSCISSDEGGSGTIGMDKCISVTIDDNDATHTTAFYLTGSSLNNEYEYNSIAVNKNTTNPNNGYIFYSPGGTSKNRFVFNRFYVGQNTGTAYSFSIDTNVEVISHFDDITASDGKTGDGTFTYVNSPSDGDIQASGSYLNMYGQAVTVGSRGGDYTTIQGAIDSITDASGSNRYTVLVYPGIYSENITLSPYIDLKSISGKASTEIRSSSGTLLTIDTTASSRVDGFKLTATGGNILSIPAGGTGKNFTFENCSFREIINNTYSSNTIALNSGKCNFVNCKFDYQHTGTGGGTHRWFLLDDIDELLFLTCELIMTVSASAQADDVEVVAENNETIPTYFWSSGFTCNRSGTVTGDSIIYSANGDSSQKYFGACFLYFNNGGSGGTGTAIKTGNNGCTVLSQGNVIEILNFDTNYSFDIDTNDTIYSNFDSVEAADEATGAGAQEYVHAHIPAGDLHVTRDIILGRNIGIDGNAGFSSGTTVNEFSTDGTLGDDSDDAVPTEKAVKTYVDTELGDYVKKDGSVSFTGTVAGVTPSGASDLTTKAYVDAIGGGGAGDLGPVEDKDLTTSPVGVLGDKYIMAGTGGNWAGGAVDDVAECTSAPNTWSFTTPVAGNTAWVTDESIQYTFDGSNWVPTGSVISHTTLQDIGTNTHTQIDTHIADTTNPHVVTKAQLSLDNVTNDAQLKRSANDWNGFGEKTSVVNNDRFIIEDSGDGLAKKYVIGSNMLDRKVKVSSNDTTQDYLSNKLIGTTDKITLTEINDGGDEDYQVDVGDDIMDVTVAGQIAGMTEKTTLVDADMVMINDSEDSNNPKMVQKSNLLPVFGTQYQETSSDTESTTTSSTYVQKLRMTTTNLPAGTYRIGFYCETGQTTTGDDVEWKVELNDTTAIAEGSDGPSTFVGDTGDRLSHGGFYNTSLSGINTIDIDYRQAGGGSAIIRRARLELWRVS